MWDVGCGIWDDLDLVWSLPLCLLGVARRLCRCRVARRRYVRRVGALRLQTIYRCGPMHGTDASLGPHTSQLLTRWRLLVGLAPLSP
jgi:hypothetical protein